MTATDYQAIVARLEHIEERCLYGQHAYEPTSVFADIHRDVAAIKDELRKLEIPS